VSKQPHLAVILIVPVVVEQPHIPKGAHQMVEPGLRELLHPKTTARHARTIPVAVDGGGRFLTPARETLGRVPWTATPGFWGRLQAPGRLRDHSGPGRKGWIGTGAPSGRPGAPDDRLSLAPFRDVRLFRDDRIDEFNDRCISNILS
jgi:hypothetical protein